MWILSDFGSRGAGIMQSMAELLDIRVQFWMHVGMIFEQCSYRRRSWDAFECFSALLLFVFFGGCD
jgi:hypothetical protein